MPNLLSVFTLPFSLSVLLAAATALELRAQTSADTASAVDTTAGDAPSATEVAAMVKVFEKNFGGTKKLEAAEAFLESLEAKAIQAAAEATDNPEATQREFDTLSGFADKAFVMAERHEQEFKIVKKKVAKVAPPQSTWPEVEFLAYAFGTRELAPQHSDATKLAAALITGRTPFSSSILPLHVRASDLARGTFATRELVLAGLLRTLDVDHGAERYARFMDSWRNPGPNGEESFYQALDRTSGSKDSVFFFDIMLAEFTTRFADTDGAKRLQTAHDHLHAAFLTYRQYRAFIEAVAHALILPHDQALPERLKRYDYDSTKGLPAGRDYSLRHQIDILLEDMGGDPQGIINLAQEVLRGHPLPDPLWSAEVDPVFFFGQRFAERKFTATTEELKAARWSKLEARAHAWRAVVKEGLSTTKP